MAFIGTVFTNLPNGVIAPVGASPFMPVGPRAPVTSPKPIAVETIARGFNAGMGQSQDTLTTLVPQASPVQPLSSIASNPAPSDPAALPQLQSAPGVFQQVGASGGSFDIPPPAVPAARDGTGPGIASTTASDALPPATTADAKPDAAGTPTIDGKGPDSTHKTIGAVLVVLLVVALFFVPKSE